jgi:hypothetical protein
VTAAAAPTPRDALRVPLNADERIPALDRTLYREALACLLRRHAGIRGASVYPIARGEAIVRVMTARGWIPILVASTDRRDLETLVVRLDAGFGVQPKVAGRQTLVRNMDYE